MPSFREIGAALGVSAQTARTDARKGLAKLRAAAGAMGLSADDWPERPETHWERMLTDPDVEPDRGRRKA